MLFIHRFSTDFLPFTIVAAALLAGCASPNRVALSRPATAPVTTVVGFRQQEIGTQIKRSNLTAAAGGGLLFALVDAGINNSRAKKAENAAGSVRDALVDYKPGEVFSSALKAELHGHPALVETLEVRTINDAKTISGWVKASPDRSLFVVDAAYQLLPDFSGVAVTAIVSLHRDGTDGTARRGLPAVTYYNAFAATWILPTSIGAAAPGQAAMLWSAGDGQAGRNTLDAAFLELAKIIAYDLTQPAPAENQLYKPPAGAERRNVAIPNMPPGFMAAGFIEKRTGERTWVRAQTGELVSLPQ